MEVGRAAMVAAALSLFLKKYLAPEVLPEVLIGLRCRNKWVQVKELRKGVRALVLNHRYQQVKLERKIVLKMKYVVTQRG